MKKPAVAPTNAHFPFSNEAQPPRDAFLRAWLSQALLRMRRELCWLGRNRQPDMLREWLQQDAMVDQRRAFFVEDPTAAYLDGLIRKTKTPLRARNPARGSFAWVAHALDLSRLEIFATALALAVARDASIGTLLAALQGDSRHKLPTPGLLQRLWEDAEALPLLSSPAHPLFARGILRRKNESADAHAPFYMPALIARMLEDPTTIASAPELECIATPTPHAAATGDNDDLDLDLLARRMAHPPDIMHMVPVAVASTLGTLDAKRAAPTLHAIAAHTGRSIFAIRPSISADEATLQFAGTCCWLAGADLLLPSSTLTPQSNWAGVLRPFPIYVFAAAPEEDTTAAPAHALPTLKISSPGFAERRTLWHDAFKHRKIKTDPEYLREAAYRFRIDVAAIAEIAAVLSRTPGELTLRRIIAACQQQIGLLIGSGATHITPRFRRADLVLDADRSAQFDELLSAMRNIARVHAEWGTGTTWGDSGVSALFAGPPGTGKTMAAEVLAAELDIPMYRVDLSQIVNKYIGETEKNLRRLFDAAEQAEVVLFFDEAESLFGQRMQTRTSNDRFANMEVGYLLERMDNFRGLAILATNRRKDLDEAFLRRLRFAIDFPMPAEAERKSIWQSSIPPQVSVDAVDLDLLAHEFGLAGGNIRSIVLNACLQAAAAGQHIALTHDIVLHAIDREYEKMGRPLTREQKAQWRIGMPTRLAVA